jgi:hypothetical protein
MLSNAEQTWVLLMTETNKQIFSKSTVKPVFGRVVAITVNSTDATAKALQVAEVPVRLVCSNGGRS